MDLTLRRLRDEAIIRRFDGTGSGPQHVVAIDDRHFVTSEPVAVLLELTRQSASLLSLASQMSERFGRSFTATELEGVLREQIPPILFRAEDSKTKGGPLHLSIRLLSAAALAPLLKLTSRLFAPPATICLVGSFLILDGFVGVELWRQGLESVAHTSMSWALALILAGVALHELGHLSACHRYGAPHGGIGIGLYWCMPVFYAEVHGAWLLTRKQRSVVDIGGAYFQSVFLLAIAASWLAHPSGTLLLVLWVSHFLLLNTLNPVLKYDGYWLLSDLSASYNLHGRVRDNARRCWRKAWRRPDTVWPARGDLLLLSLFLTLATVYFGYVFYFMAHNLAFAASRLQLAGADWHWAASALGLVLSSGFAVGVTLMLAHAVEDVVGLEAMSDLRKRDAIR